MQIACQFPLVKHLVSLYNLSMFPRRVFLLILAALVMLSSLSARMPQQQDDGIFFEDAGFWVRGEFYQFYRAAPDPDRLFGNPISDPLPDPVRPGITVQYFERARFDLDPTRPAGQRVSLGDLGRNLRDEARPGEPANFSTNTPMCRAFSNGNTVCYAFLQFYDGHEGNVYFGPPVSDTEFLDGRLVQYFEHARMEWLPDRPAGQRVVMSELGRIDYNIRVGQAPEGGSRTGLPTRLTAHAFTAAPVVAVGDSQEVFVVVYDQQGSPVPDANVMVTVRYPDGREENYRPERLTNADGFTSIVFTVEDVAPNQVVEIIANVDVPNGPKATARTWFRIWW